MDPRYESSAAPRSTIFSPVGPASQALRRSGTPLALGPVPLGGLPGFHFSVDAFGCGGHAPGEGSPDVRACSRVPTDGPPLGSHCQNISGGAFRPPAPPWISFLRCRQRQGVPCVGDVAMPRRSHLGRTENADLGSPAGSAAGGEAGGRQRLTGTPLPQGDGRGAPGPTTWRAVQLVYLSYAWLFRIPCGYIQYVVVRGALPSPLA